MNARTPYLLTLFGLAGMAIVGLHRWDGFVFAFIVALTLLTLSALAWEARAR
jgi:hypothetical protein